MISSSPRMVSWCWVAEKSLSNELFIFDILSKDKESHLSSKETGKAGYWEREWGLELETELKQDMSQIGRRYIAPSTLIATDNSQVTMVTGYLKESGDHSMSYIFPPFLLRCNLVYQLLLHLQCLQRREKHSSPANAFKESACVRKPSAIIYWVPIKNWVLPPNQIFNKC